MRSTAAVLIGILGLACGGDELDQTAASHAANEVINASSLAYTNVSTELQGTPGSWVARSGDTFDISGDLQGAQGGTATVTGSGKQDGTTYTFDLSITLKGWKGTSGLVLDGTFKAAHVVTNLTGSLMTVTYSGEVSVGGSASGEAKLEFKVVYTPGQFAICGSVSDRDVSTESC